MVGWLENDGHGGPAMAGWRARSMAMAGSRAGAIITERAMTWWRWLAGVRGRFLTVLFLGFFVFLY